jgi:hypothetical protein
MFPWSTIEGNWWPNDGIGDDAAGFRSLLEMLTEHGHRRSDGVGSAERSVAGRATNSAVAPSRSNGIRP